MSIRAFVAAAVVCWLVLAGNPGLADSPGRADPAVPVSEPGAEDISRAFAALWAEAQAMRSALDGPAVEDPAVVERIHNRVVLPLLEHWDLEVMLEGLLGAQHYRLLSPREKEQLQEALADTLTRYVFEVLAGAGDGSELRDVTVHVEPDTITVREHSQAGYIHAIVDKNWLPPLPLRLPLLRKDGTWAIQDIEVASISYIGRKRGTYQRLVEQGGAERLVSYLQAKNSEHFARFCAQVPADDPTVPRYIDRACG
ncbi:hypothetical protein CWI75_15770 [Kineobactrum sediminis]|uniref:ABC transporter substrate-binding protein n=1 Tax=Kineobactrum sediminis TaxID=1905677 RepID=A0A2N5XZ99_9GAMM|nr:ABC transporter substrate-binding protein [Kineobactrum sediminis]PLW81477.1 hypothetical protein CWI75_15770 [Kineobactrum sediminis]